MKKFILAITALTFLAAGSVAQAYCVINQTGQAIKVDRTNCNLPGDRQAFGCDYKVTSKTCELGKISSEYKTSHLWVFNSDRKLLCSVNIKNKGDTLIIKSAATGGKSNCQLAAL